MAMSNAWYRAEYKPFEEESKRVRNRMERANPVKFTEGPHYPRYYFADQIVTITDNVDFISKVSSGKYSDRAAFVSAPAFPPAPAAVRGVRETANTATIDVESSGLALLVMSVTPHKYWQVTLDGGPIRPTVANLGYQSVLVPRGRHRIAMRYSNPLVIRGAIVSAMSTLLLLGIACVRPRKIHR
jgi:uncharacterized membrane protein YfhO